MQLSKAAVAQTEKKAVFLRTVAPFTKTSYDDKQKQLCNISPQCVQDGEVKKFVISDNYFSLFRIGRL
jgi:hypothetical protein